MSSERALVINSNLGFISHRLATITRTSLQGQAKVDDLQVI